MDARKKTNIPVVAIICLITLFICQQYTAYAAEATSSGHENVQNTLYIEFVYQNTGKAINVNGVNIQSSKLSSFVFRNAETHQEIAYKKLIINGNTVINSRVYSETGLKSMDVVEFLFEGGKFIQFSAPIKSTIPKQYKLENGTLTLLD